MQGIKHLVECQCVLPQFRNATPPVYHKFVVFSVVNDSDSVTESVAKCNNCGILHRVFEIGKSEILLGDEEGSGSILSKEDMRLMIPTAISQVLDSYSADIATWQQCLFVLENEKWDVPILIAKEQNDDNGTVKGKIMKIVPPGRVKLETFVDQMYLGDS